jgi:hypothetical protein
MFVGGLHSKGIVRKHTEFSQETQLELWATSVTLYASSNNENTMNPAGLFASLKRCADQDLSITADGRIHGLPDTARSSTSAFIHAEVQVEVFPVAGEKERVIIEAENYGDRYAVALNRDLEQAPLAGSCHSLHEDSCRPLLQVSIYSEAPAGASTGTSAAVSVALIGALDRLTPGRMTPHEGHRSTPRRNEHAQPPVGFRISSAQHSGINYIENAAVPWATVSQIQVPNSTW